MIEYPKIETLFVRDEKTGKVLTDKWRLPEFEYLANNSWRWTEKIDGTNVRVGWENGVLQFGGRTDSAQMPVFLLNKLQALFTSDKMAAAFGAGPVTLYGEGYGAKIQKGGGNYIPDGVDFILFDVLVGDWWLEWPNVEDVAAKLDLSIVPTCCVGALHGAVESVRQSFRSTIGTATAEGFVVRPMVDLRSRRGHRIIGKIKTRDFA